MCVCVCVCVCVCLGCSGSSNLENVESSQNLTEDDVFPIQLRQGVQREEKLRSVRVFAGITCVGAIQPRCVYKLSEAVKMDHSVKVHSAERDAYP